MSRHDESIGRMPNPSQYYLEWNSELNSFCYFSTETENRIPFPLPFRFIALKFMNTITGYDRQRSLGFYANEVSDTRYEHFRVQYRDGSHLATGLYPDIKETIIAAGGRFTRSIYAVTPKGIIVNIKLRGEQMIAFGTLERFGNRWKDEWIEVSRFIQKTYEVDGKVQPYSIPVFEFGGSLSPADTIKADKAYELVKDYFASKPARHDSRPAPAPARPAAPAPRQDPAPAFIASPGNDDDLPF